MSGNSSSNGAGAERLPYDVRDVVRITRDMRLGMVRLVFKTNTNEQQAMTLNIGKVNGNGIEFLIQNSGGQFAEVDSDHKTDAERDLEIWARLDNPAEPDRQRLMNQPADGEEGDDAEAEAGTEDKDDKGL